MDHAVVRESTLRSHYESVKRVISVMRDRIDEPMSLRSLAKIGFASPYHFTRTFRRVTGLPPSHFLSALRLDVARRLLLHTRRKVIDICYDVGYSSVGTFTRRFTDSFGVPPGVFRAMAQSQPHADYTQEDPHMPLDGRRIGQSLSGHVTAPSEFNGLVCVGLFATPIPQSRPLACAIAATDGHFEMHDVPEGTSFLFALGLEHPISPSECFYQESALRGGGQSVHISREGVHGVTDLFLRPPFPTDPPILLFLTNLMENFNGERRNGDVLWPVPAFHGDTAEQASESQV